MLRETHARTTQAMGQFVFIAVKDRGVAYGTLLLMERIYGNGKVMHFPCSYIRDMAHWVHQCQANTTKGS